MKALSFHSAASQWRRGVFFTAVVEQKVSDDDVATAKGVVVVDRRPGAVEQDVAFCRNLTN